MRQSFFLLVLAVVLATQSLSAQTTIRGQVVNERGESVEYVSIGFEEDSVGTISDAKGYFSLTIPAGRKKELAFSHVSYLTTEIPYQEYANGKTLTVVLKDKVVELTEVVVGKKNKPKTIVGKGVPLPGGVIGVSAPNKSNASDSYEGGVTFSCSKDYVISDILLNISGCSFNQCTLSINLYEKRDGQFVNVLQKPIYEIVRQETGKHVLDIHPDETLLVKRKTDYYLSMSVVDSDCPGMLYIKVCMKSGLYRSAVKGKTKRLPVCPAILVKGFEVDQTQRSQWI